MAPTLTPSRKGIRLQKISIVEQVLASPGKMVLRVGVVSTAGIASKNYLAMTQSAGVKCVAVSSRTLEKAQAWAAERGGGMKAYGSHAELFADAEIDAVYIPAPTGVRLPLVQAAAASGKSVLIEKPIAPTAAEAEQMVAACSMAGVVFMDGVMFMHNERLPALRAAMDEVEFGELRRVVSDFGFCGDDAFHGSGSGTDGNIRVDPALEPLGSLGDLGIYNTRLALFAFGWQLPVSVSAVCHTRRHGVPIDISSTLNFGGGRSSTFTNSFETSFRQHAAFVGTGQSIEITDMCLSGTTSTECAYTLYRKHGLTKHDVLVEKEVEEVAVKMAHGQEVSMWEKFRELHEARAEDTKGPDDMDGRAWWATQALNTQRVLDALMASAAQDGKVVAL